MSDIAAHFPPVRDEILTEQLNLLTTLIEKIVFFCKSEAASDDADSMDNESEATLEARVDIMKIVCMTLGTIRSIGRYSVSKEQPLLSHLFPLPFVMKEESTNIAPVKLTVDSSNWFWKDGEKEVKPLRNTPSKHGCSFVNSIPKSGSRPVFAFCFDEIQRLTNLLLQLVDQDILSRLDKIALEVFISGELRRFPYKSISETVELVVVTLLRDALAPYSMHDDDAPVPDVYAKKINQFSLRMFKRGQELISQRESLKDNPRHYYLKNKKVLDADSVVNRVKMLVVSNSICLELFVWSAVDENGLFRDQT